MEILEELDGAPPAVPPMLAAAYPDRFRKITNYELRITNGNILA